MGPSPFWLTSHATALTPASHFATESISVKDLRSCPDHDRSPRHLPRSPAGRGRLSRVVAARGRPRYFSSVSVGQIPALLLHDHDRGVAEFSGMLVRGGRVRMEDEENMV